MKVNKLIIGAISAVVLNFSNYAQASDSDQSPIKNMPDELLLQIFSHLNIDEALNASAVSQQFRQLACDKSLPQIQQVISQNSKLESDIQAVCHGGAFSGLAVKNAAKRVISADNKAGAVLASTSGGFMKVKLKAYYLLAQYFSNNSAEAKPYAEEFIKLNGQADKVIKSQTESMLKAMHNIVK